MSATSCKIIVREKTSGCCTDVARLFIIEYFATRLDFIINIVKLSEDDGRTRLQSMKKLNIKVLCNAGRIRPM